LLCTATSMNGEQLAQKVLEALAHYTRAVREGGRGSRVVTVFDFEKLAGVTNDGCAVNLVCNTALMPFLPNSNSLVCISHMANNSGGAFNTPERALFLLHWCGIFTCSHMSRDLWNARIGCYTKTTHSATRWYGAFEIETTAFRFYPDVLPFLEDDLGEKDGNAVICPEHRRQCLSQQWDEDRNEKLQVEMAAVQDKATNLVKTCYLNEGEYNDEIFKAYDRLMAAQETLESASFIQTRAVVKRICTKNGTQPMDQAKHDNLMAYAEDCTQPAVDYYRTHLESNEFATNVSLFKAFRLFNPAMDHTTTTADDLLPLKELRYIQNNPNVYDELLEQLGAYVATCQTVTEIETGIRGWWQDQYRAAYTDDTEAGYSPFPQWIDMARFIAVQVPSSAIVERVFSLVKSLFGHTQLATYGDAIEAAVMANMQEDKWQRGENI